MNARAITALALFASLALSCSRTHAPTAASEPAAQAMGADAVLAQTPIFERMMTAPTTVRHGGTRRLQYHYDIAGVPHGHFYEERVLSDGQGQFALDPLRVVTEPPMTHAQREAFELVQKSREGFFFRFRDFGVRKRELFFANYRIVDLHTNPIVAGRSCTELEIERITAGNVKYRLAVDTETALVMRSIEIAPTGQELARSEFIEFTLDPVVPSDVQWFTPRYEGVPMDAATVAATGLTFPPLTPKLLPTGYRLLQSELVREGSNAWMRRVYSDGVENLFLLQKGVRATQRDLSTSSPVTRTGSGPELDQAPAVGAGSYTVRLLCAGPWTLAEVSRADEQIFVVGKIGEDEVLRVLKSSL